MINRTCPDHPKDIRHVQRDYSNKEKPFSVVYQCGCSFSRSYEEYQEGVKLKLYKVIENEHSVSLPKEPAPVKLTIAVDKRKPPEIVHEEEVYCSECEFCRPKVYKRMGIYSPDTDACFHVLNMTERRGHLAIMYKLINHPEEINKDNDCSWFVKKRGFSHRLFRGRHKDRIGSGKKVYLPEWPDPPPRKP